MVPIRIGDIARMAATLRIYQGRSRKRKERHFEKEGSCTLRQFYENERRKMTTFVSLISFSKLLLQPPLNTVVVHSIWSTSYFSAVRLFEVIFRRRLTGQSSQ